MVQAFCCHWGVWQGPACAVGSKRGSASLWLRMNILKYLSVHVEFSAMCGKNGNPLVGASRWAWDQRISVACIPWRWRCWCSRSLSISSSAKTLSLGANVQHSSGAQVFCSLVLTVIQCVAYDMCQAGRGAGKAEAVCKGFFRAQGQPGQPSRPLMTGGSFTSLELN